MTTTVEHTRPKLRKPVLREVCLIGDPSRRYIHRNPEGLGAGESRRKGTGKVGAG